MDIYFGSHYQSTTQAQIFAKTRDFYSSKSQYINVESGCNNGIVFNKSKLKTKGK